MNYIEKNTTIDQVSTTIIANQTRMLAIDLQIDTLLVLPIISICLVMRLLEIDLVRL
jgi:hypothetical protein